MSAKAIYTITRKWHDATIEHDAENEKPWRVCRGKKKYAFMTFRECLCYCFGKGWLPLYETIDYGTLMLPERLKEVEG